MRSVTPRRILVITEGGMGDQVALVPALRELKKSIPNAYLCVFITFRHPTDPAKQNPFVNLLPSQVEKDSLVLAANTYIDEIYVLNRYAFRDLRMIERAKAEMMVVKFLRQKRFDTAICTFPHKDRFILWSLISGAAIRVGAKNQGLRWLLTVTPDIERSQGGVVEYFCNLVRPIGCTISSTRTEYVPPKSSVLWADRRLRELHVDPSQKLVAVHPGASGGYKVWPPERYAALIDHLSSKLDCVALLLKSTGDDMVVSAIRAHLRHKIVEVDCSGNIGDLAAVMMRCALCISNDSGPRHLAVAVGTPSLAFFRLHHDKEWDVYQGADGCASLKSSAVCPACPPEECFDRLPGGEQFGCHCLRMISLEDAVREVERMLTAPGASRYEFGDTKTVTRDQAG